MPKSNNVVVIGNPPYNEGAGRESKVLYNLFIETIIDCIEPNKFSMIVPSRWMCGGKGLDSFRERMMNDRRIRLIRHFPFKYDIFPDVDIENGVNYFLWESEYDGYCDFNGVVRPLNEYDIIVQNDKCLSVIKKVIGNTTCFLSNRVYNTNQFNIKSDFKNWSRNGVICYSRYRKLNYISTELFNDKFNIIDKWKVCVSRLNGNNTNGLFTKFNSLFIVPPGSVITQTYIVIGTTETELEAINYRNYVGTKLVRFIIGSRLSSINLNKSIFKWVPDQLDYTKEYTDEELYKKYNLSQEEINYIESLFEDNPLCSFSTNYNLLKT